MFNLRQRSFYGRLLRAFNFIMLLMLVVNMMAFVTVRQNLSNSQQIEKMQRDADFLSGMATQMWTVPDSLSSRTFNAIVTQYLDGGTEIWVVRSLGLFYMRTIYNTGANMTEEMMGKISEDVTVNNSLDQVMSGEKLIVTGVFSKHFNNLPVVTVAVPIKGVFEMNIGALYLHRQIQPVAMDMLNSLLAVTAMVTMFITLIPLIFITRNMTRPLYQMALASERYAKGDFSQRVPPSKIREVDMLAGSLNKMAEDLAKLEDLRVGFVANVSHELRSPLTSMQGYVQAILDGTIMPGDQSRYLSVVLDETKRLTRLVADLLDLSRIEAGNMPIQNVKFDLCELIRRVLIKYDARIEEKRIDVDVLFRPEQCFVDADPDRVEQVVSNLVDNAIKFLPEGGTLTLLSNQSIDSVFVTVKDNGPGIPEEDVPFVFERFYKADKAHTSGGGTGLGLSIASKIIESHGYTLTCTSKQGEGASFDFELKRWNGV